MEQPTPKERAMLHLREHWNTHQDSLANIVFDIEQIAVVMLMEFGACEFVPKVKLEISEIMGPNIRPRRMKVSAMRLDSLRKDPRIHVVTDCGEFDFCDLHLEDREFLTGKMWEALQ